MKKNPDVEFVTCNYDPYMEHLSQYFKLRHDVYREFGLFYYDNFNPTRYDIHPDTVFMLVVETDTGKVVGGRRFLVHQVRSLTKLYVEVNSKILMEYIMPHIDTELFKYAELGSLCLHKSVRGTDVSKRFYKAAFDYIRKEKFDFCISNPVPHNILRLHNSAKDNGVKQFSWRTDIKALVDGDGDSTMFMSFKSQEEFDLLPTEVRQAGIGNMPTEEEVKQMVEQRNWEVKNDKINYDKTQNKRKKD